MDRWLPRLWLVFFIFAAILGYDAFTAAIGRGRPIAHWQIWVEFILALGCLIFGFAGLRARHQPPEDNNEE